MKAPVLIWEGLLVSTHPLHRISSSTNDVGIAAVPQASDRRSIVGSGGGKRRGRSERAVSGETLRRCISVRRRAAAGAGRDRRRAPHPRRRHPQPPGVPQRAQRRGAGRGAPPFAVDRAKLDTTRHSCLHRRAIHTSTSSTRSSTAPRSAASWWRRCDASRPPRRCAPSSSPAPARRLRRAQTSRSSRGWAGRRRCGG